MSKHLGTSYRSIESDHSCGWDLLVLSKDDLDFSGTSYFPACGTSKEIELLWDEVSRNGVMVLAAGGQLLFQGWTKPLQQKPWTGESGWDGSRSTDASQGLEPTQSEERIGAQHWFSPEKGRPCDSLQIPGGRGGRKHCPSFVTGSILSKGWGR